MEDKFNKCYQFLVDHDAYNGEHNYDLIQGVMDYIILKHYHPEERVEALCKCGFTDDEIIPYFMDWYRGTIRNKDHAVERIKAYHEFYNF